MDCASPTCKDDYCQSNYENEKGQCENIDVLFGKMQHAKYRTLILFHCISRNTRYSTLWITGGESFVALAQRALCGGMTLCKCTSNTRLILNLPSPG